jgi:signal transduction histidine kinase
MAGYEEIRAARDGRITLFHAVVVCLSLTMAFSAYYFSQRQTNSRIQSRYEVARDQVLGLVTDRMQKYEDALWAGTAAIASLGGEISHEEWRSFALTLRLGQKYPGINGIGVIHFNTPGTIDAYLAEQRGPRPGFRVYPAHDQPILMPTTYIEPVAQNRAAVGLDIAHEVNRRTAALLSRDTGRAQITGPIVLVQDAGSTPGFLFYVPFYGDDTPDTLVARREAFRGLVFAPFIVHKLMEGLLAKGMRDLKFSIRDGEQVIYDEHDPDDPLFDPSPLFAETISLDLYGRTWTFDIRTDLGFRRANSYVQPKIIFVAGLVIEGLIIALLVMMSRANGRAVRYADRVTLDLRRKSRDLMSVNAELARKNEELEQFAYVTSHDLKTPIRGISGLTDMIREDLGKYLVSPEANPEVRQNLDRIQERVRRMTDLTDGIMQFSRVGSYEEGAEALDLAEAVATLRWDHGLEPHQLVLEGDGTAVGGDPFHLRRVLENLVGNSVKHHPDRAALRIALAVGIADDRLAISVSDNGPGIEPRFHKRIFDVFQTLRSGGAAESTGIGLAIVKKCVERNGGEVWVASKPGEGATFGFDWPRTGPSVGRADSKAA